MSTVAYQVISAQSVARAIAAIKGGPVNKTSTGFEVRCIAHDDHDPSMSVSNSTDGKRVLVHCHAGCSQPDVMAALKVHSIRLSAESSGSARVTQLQPRGISLTWRGAKLTRWWAYIRQDGEIAGYTARYDSADGSKSVIPYFQTGPDGWISGHQKNDEKRCLYGLHTTGRPGPVWVTEGEKAADSVIERGGCAVSPPGGSKSPHKADWSPLSGRDVIIWPDHDQPGIDFAKRVTSQIKTIAKSVRFVDVASMYPTEPGWDAYDWDGKNLAEVKTLSFGEWIANPSQQAAKTVSPPGGDRGWAEKMAVTSSGSLIPCLGNATDILINDDQWMGRIKLNRFSETISLDGKSILDVYASEVCISISRKYGTQFKTATVWEAIQVVAERLAYHPVREYLQSITWDRLPRIDSWLDDAFETGITPYTMAVGRNFMIGAVARIMRPGCQMDNMLILEGPQGGGKTSAIRTLAGEEWYSDSLEKIGTKDFLQALRGKWFVELGELDSMRSADVTKIKQTITSRVDNYRPSYGRVSRDYPRQNVFLGTTNNQEGYLHDATGARRFWPVECASVNLLYLSTMRDQLWAEAFSLYNAGEKWHIVPDQATQDEQEKRYDDDVWHVPVELWAYNHQNEPFTTHRVLSECLLIEIGRQSRTDQMRVGNILKRLGYKKSRARLNGLLVNVFKK